MFKFISNLVFKIFGNKQQKVKASKLSVRKKVRLAVPHKDFDKMSRSERRKYVRHLNKYGMWDMEVNNYYEKRQKNGSK